MMNFFSSIILVLLAAWAICPAAAGSGNLPAGEQAVITKTIRDSIGWALTKDRPLAESVLAHDERLFMFNPDSASTAGWSELVKNFDFWMDPRFKATSMDIRDLRLDLSASGTVAWWSCILDDLGEWDGRPIGWKDTRWTGVLEKRDGRWVIVQMHFSFASDKVIADAKARLQTQGADPRQAVLDYLEGWYEGDAAKVERVLHPRFVRRIAAETGTGDDLFEDQDRSGFLEAVRQGGGKAIPAGQRQINAAVRDLARTTATVRADSAGRVEYISLVKLHDRWQIVNVLWEKVPAGQ